MSRIKNLREEALSMHKDNLGKIEVRVKVPVRDTDDLTLAYSPGVAEPCMEINKNPEMLDVYTNHSNFVCVVSNGTAVLGLGDIGPAAALPVMEGKSLLFKTFGDVDAFPICVNTKDTQKIIEIIELMAPTFGGVNLEDIKAPECFIIEDGLKERGIFKGAIFHDDQHGTAVVTLAGLINALKVVGKKLEDVKVVTSGAGAAGIAIIKLLMAVGLKNVIMCDSRGAIWEGRPEGMNPYKDEIAKRTNPGKVKGGQAEAIKGADVFIGVSAPGTLNEDMIRSMAKDPIVFAQANPVPEIWPLQRAYDAGAKVVSTGRSDCPNQINNVLAFPGIFRGAIDVRATDINDAMKIAAAYALADLVKPEELGPQMIIPSTLNPDVAPMVAEATAKAAMNSGIARVKIDPAVVAENLRKRLAKQVRA
nr:malic enzyme-like NAD(P)-binding protein [uncultured Desulfovibrio sp.]